MEGIRIGYFDDYPGFAAVADEVKHSMHQSGAGYLLLTWRGTEQAALEWANRELSKLEVSHDA